MEWVLWRRRPLISVPAYVCLISDSQYPLLQAPDVDTTTVKDENSCCVLRLVFKLPYEMLTSGHDYKYPR